LRNGRRGYDWMKRLIILEVLNSTAQYNISLNTLNTFLDLLLRNSLEHSIPRYNECNADGYAACSSRPQFDVCPRAIFSH